MPHRGGSPAPGRRGPIVIRAYGHRHVRATHHKTLEVTRDEEITGRATCVIGVAAEEFPAVLPLVRGRVRITVTAGAAELTGHATINPAHEVTRRLVIRRSGRQDRDTLAIRADFAADTLEPSLVAELGRPGAVVTVTIEETEPPPPLLILGRPDRTEPPGRAGTLWRNADAAIALDESSIRRTDEARAAMEVLTAGGTVAATVLTPLDRVPVPVMAWITEATRQHRARVLAAHAPGSGDVALLAAGLPPAPSVRLGRINRRAVRRPELATLLRQESVPVVVTVPVAEVGGVLGPVATVNAERPAALADEASDVGIGMHWSTLADVVARAPVGDAETFDEVTVVLGARDQGGLPGDLRAMIEALLAAGIPARAVSEALKPWGVRRDQIYARRGA